MAKKRPVWFWLVIGFCALVIIAAAFWVDPFVHNWIVQHHNRNVRVVMGAISRYGDWPEHVAIGLLLVVLAWWRGNRKWTRVFLSMLIACALAGGAARVIKIGTGRARPSVKAELAWNGPQLSEKYHAFPSGHTAASTAFFGVLVFVSWRIGVACLFVPLLIALSRMYVAAHYLSDVVFAGTLGLACALIVTRTMRLTAPRRGD